jgi:hypothetical protein
LKIVMMCKRFTPMPIFPRSWSVVDMETVSRIRNASGFGTGYRLIG